MDSIIATAEALASCMDSSPRTWELPLAVQSYQTGAALAVESTIEACMAFRIVARASSLIIAGMGTSSAIAFTLVTAGFQLAHPARFQSQLLS